MCKDLRPRVDTHSHTYIQLPSKKILKYFNLKNINFFMSIIVLFFVIFFSLFWGQGQWVPWRFASYKKIAEEVHKLLL